MSTIEERTSTELLRDNSDKGHKVPLEEVPVPLSSCPQQTPRELSRTEPRPWRLTVCAMVRATGVAVVIQAPQVHHTDNSFCHDTTAYIGQGLLIVEVSRLHPETPHSLGLLCKSDQPDAETST